MRADARAAGATDGDGAGAGGRGRLADDIACFGGRGGTGEYPACQHAAYTAAEADLWRWTVREALVARMGWLLSRLAGRVLVGSDLALDALLTCERTPLPGTVPPALELG